MIRVHHVKLRRNNKVKIPRPVFQYALKEAKLIAEETGEPLERVLSRVLRSEAVKRYMKSYTEYVEVELRDEL